MITCTVVIENGFVVDTELSIDGIRVTTDLTVVEVDKDAGKVYRHLARPEDAAGYVLNGLYASTEIG